MSQGLSWAKLNFDQTPVRKGSKLLLLEFEQNQMDRPHRSWKRDPRARYKRFASSNERVLKLSILNYFLDFSLAGFVKDSFGWYPPAFYMSGAFLTLSGSSCSFSRSVCKTRSSRSWKCCHKRSTIGSGKMYCCLTSAAKDFFSWAERDGSGGDFPPSSPTPYSPPTPNVFVVSYPDPPRPGGCKVRLSSYS